MDSKEKPAESEAAPRMVTIEGCVFPKMLFLVEPEKHIAAMRNMEVRPDDVFVCAFPKAGTHWTWELVTMLLKGKAEYEPRTKITMMMDFMPIEEFAAMPSPRVFNTHFLFRFLPYQIREKGAKMIYVTRNPKDVAVSFYHLMKGVLKPFDFKGTFQDYLEKRFLIMPPGMNWFYDVQDWEKVMECLPDLNILPLVYEDMKEDPCSTVARLSEFLGTGASKELCQQIAEACDFDKLKEADKTKVKGAPEFRVMDEQFMKNSGIFRKGQVGDWKNWFTVAQNEMFDKVYEEKMKHSKLTFRYTL